MSLQKSYSEDKAHKAHPGNEEDESRGREFFFDKQTVQTLGRQEPCEKNHEETELAGAAKMAEEGDETIGEVLNKGLGTQGQEKGR